MINLRGKLRGMATPRGAKSGRSASEPGPALLFDEKSLDDAAFLEECYLFFLQRPADPDGLEHFSHLLSAGAPRAEAVRQIMASDEFKSLQARHIPPSLPSLREMRPEKYVVRYHRQTNQEMLFFRVESRDDFDWLEEQILGEGYYDNLSVWETGVDEDKRNLAEMAGCFKPAACLEIGCFTGPVLLLLQEAGVRAEGVEVSHLALAMAHRKVRQFIHFGALKELNLPPEYDLLLGMDVFEHLNPNRLNDYLAECRRLLGGGGYLFTNIPAYGHDPVYGPAHGFALDEWEQQAARDENFSLIQVDGQGWPVSGHLIWADWKWWQGAFEAKGFKRETGLEKALHQRFDGFIDEKAPARRSFFVFSVGNPAKDAGELISQMGE